MFWRCCSHFFSCSNSRDSLSLTADEQSQIDYMIALLEESGWKKDPNVNDDVRNRNLLNLGLDSVKAIADFISKISIGGRDNSAVCEIADEVIASRGDIFNVHEGGNLYTATLQGGETTSSSDWYHITMGIQYEYPTMYAVVWAGVRSSFSSRWVSDEGSFRRPRRFQSTRADAYVRGLLYIGDGYSEVVLHGWIEVNPSTGIAIRGGVEM